MLNQIWTMYISVKIAYFLFFFSLTGGIFLVLILATLCFKKITQVEIIVPNKDNKEITVCVITNQNINRSNELQAKICPIISSDLIANTKKIIDKKLDLSYVNSKYMNKSVNNPLFTNYLLKSKRPFLGY